VSANSDRYDEAVRGLRSPITWCSAAMVLAAIGDTRALLPLLRAYDSPVEAPKACLLQAIAKLHPGRSARALYARGTSDERRAALRLVELFSDDRDLSLIERAIGDVDPSVRQQACTALTHHDRTSAWEAGLIRVLAVGDKLARLTAVCCLAQQPGDTAHAALSAGLIREQDPAVRSEIQAAVGGSGSTYPRS
jgi:HEAT repeat protein